MTEHVAEFSLLLSLLGAGVMVLAALAATSWLRLAQRGSRPLRHLRELGMAAAALGTGVFASAELTLSAEGLRFQLGYHPLQTAGLWLLAVVGCLPVVGLLTLRPRSAVLAASGAILALVIIAVQMGWVAAAGLVPGVNWRWKSVAIAAVVLVTGISSAWWMLSAATHQAGVRRALMRTGGLLLLSLVILAGQELLVWSAGLQDQKRAEYAYDLNAAPVSLFCGVVVPIVLAMLAVHVSLQGGRRSRRESRDSSTPTPRRRRRERTHSA